MKLIGLGAALALGVSASLTAQQPASGHPAHEDQRVTLTGCVVKADDGYVLTNAVQLPATAGTAGAVEPPVTQPARSAPPVGRVFYWLEEDDDLEGRAGHRVEISGEIDDIDPGTISVEREEGMIELEFKVDGDKKVTVKLPDTPAAGAPVGTSGIVATDRERDYDVKVKKIDVKSVRMIASTC